MPGAAQCIVNLYRTKERLEDGARKAVKDWATDTLNASKKITPIDTGHMVSTGIWVIIKNTLTEFFVRISYNTPYAMKQHETPWYHHPIGQWKFLSTPFNQRSPLLIKMVEAAWRNVLWVG
jgi:hypothetical protein